MVKDLDVGGKLKISKIWSWAILLLFIWYNTGEFKSFYNWYLMLDTSYGFNNLLKEVIYWLILGA